MKHLGWEQKMWLITGRSMQDAFHANAPFGDYV